MKVRDILNRINRVAPFSLAEEWDNTGLMAGNPDQEVRRLGVALDPLPEALEEAFRKGCQALLSHHPLFFSPIKSLDFSTEPGSVVEMAARYGMAVMSAHTNWDSAEGGVSRILADRLGLADVAPLERSDVDGCGMGAVGEFKAPVPIREGLDALKRSWGLTRIDYYGSTDCSILRVALCGGSGGSLRSAALSVGADLYVTADMKYHEILECVRSGLSIAVVDHAEMESLSLNELANRLADPDELETVIVEYRALDTPLRV